MTSYHFLFLDNIEKIQEKFKLSLNTFEYIMENGAFTLKYMIFQRPQKALYSKMLSQQSSH